MPLKTNGDHQLHFEQMAFKVLNARLGNCCNVSREQTHWGHLNGGTETIKVGNSSYFECSTAKDGGMVRFYWTVAVLPPSTVDLPGANKAGNIVIVPVQDITFPQQYRNGTSSAHSALASNLLFGTVAQRYALQLPHQLPVRVLQFFFLFCVSSKLFVNTRGYSF